MAYNYLDLVNEVNRRLNEVELTSTGFDSVIGFQATIKDAVNASLRDINHSHYEWPFNFVVGEDTLSVGTTRYAFPTDANTIDFDSFRIKKNSTYGNETKLLKLISYDDYLKNYISQEYDSSKIDIPTMVFHAPGNEYGVSPAPDNSYEVVYEYYRIPVDLEKYYDVPALPERFKHVIVEGAMYHAYMFRSNEQAASIAKSKFEDGIKKMRIMLINENDYMRSTVISRG